MHGAILQSRSATGCRTTAQNSLSVYSQQTLLYTVAHSVQGDFGKLYEGQEKFYSNIDELSIGGNLGRAER